MRKGLIAVSVTLSLSGGCVDEPSPHASDGSTMPLGVEDFIRSRKAADALALEDSFRVSPPRPAAPGHGFSFSGQLLTARIGVDDAMEFERYSVSVERVAAGAASAQLVDGVVVLKDTFVDRYIFATETGVEDLLVMREAGEDLSYEVDLPPGWTMQAVTSWMVVLKDPSRVERLRFAVPAAWDAEGASVAVELNTDGDRIELVVGASSNYPIAIDPEWSETSTPAVIRRHHTSTLLGDGRVLLAGGETRGYAEIYDPTLDIYEFAGTYISSPPRREASATLLPSGEVLIAGGTEERTSEIYNPRDRTFRSGPILQDDRSGHAAALLPNGKVLLAGGYDGEGTLPSATAELVDVTTSTSELTSTPLSEGYSATAITLSSGKVLIVNPFGADLYNPATGTLEAGGVRETYHGGAEPLSVVPYSRATLTMLPSGDVLVVQGGVVNELNDPLPAEIYHPASRTFAPTAAPHVSRFSHTATLLQDGSI